MKSETTITKSNTPDVIWTEPPNAFRTGRQTDLSRKVRGALKAVSAKPGKWACILTGDKNTVRRVAPHVRLGGYGAEEIGGQWEVVTRNDGKAYGLYVRFTAKRGKK